MMKKKIVYPFAVALMIIGATVYFSQIDTGTSTLHEAGEPASGTAAIVNAGPSISSSRPAAESKKGNGYQPPLLAGVGTFKDLNAKVSRSGANVADALKIKSTALLLCQRSDAELDEELARRVSKGAAPDSAGNSLNAFKAYRHRFCVGLDNESFGKTISELGVTDPNGDYAISTTLFHVDDKAKAVDIATTLIETSTSPDAINNAAIFLANAKNGGWDLGKEIVQGRYFSSQLPQIQEMAATLVACDLSGGCGPDGIYSWAACSNYDLCRPGISLEDVWSRTNSPDVVEAASRIADILRRKRANG